MWMIWTMGLGCSVETPDGTPRPAPDAETPEPDDGVAGTELLRRLAGLWTGAARQTPLGTFPRMDVDLRPADAHALWGRVDVDPDNALRFALQVEDHDGPVLVYRNGGFFLGMSRDDRTVLVETGEDRWRFCHLERGCDYIDATWSFDGPDDLLLDVQVKGQSHVYWDAHRAETRPLPDAFPDPSPLPGDVPLPTLPSAELTVSWSTPLAETADVWVLFTTTACSGLDCVPSRASRAVAETGATSVVVRMPEIHAGAYFASAVVDRDRDLGTSLLPEASDGVSLPNRPVNVDSEGTTREALRIVLGG